MKLLEAQRRVKRSRAVALVVLVVSSIFIVVSGLKSVGWAVHGDTTPFAVVGNAIQRLVYYVFEQTQFLSWVWQVAPIANPRELNSTGNLGFFFIASCGALGRLMWDSASHLSRRIKETIRRVEEVGWEQSLLAKQGQIAGRAPDVLQITIDLEQKDQWYKRPLGLVLIGVAIAVLGQWANLRFGLVK